MDAVTKLICTLVVGVALAAPAAASLPPMLTIPALGIHERVNYRSPDGGPYLWYSDRDTVAIAGHRVTHRQTFLHIDRLRRGAHITLGGVHFIVVRHEIVRPTDRAVLGWSGLVLSACAPEGSDRYRYVVLARRT